MNSQTELGELAGKLRKAWIGFSMVVDEGRTEIEGGTRTCLGIVPMPKDHLEPFVGHLKLYR